MSITPREFEAYLWSAWDELRHTMLSHEGWRYLVALFFLRLLSERFKDESINTNQEQQGTSLVNVPNQARWISIAKSSIPAQAVRDALHSITLGDEPLIWNGLFSELGNLERYPQLYRRLVSIVSDVDLTGATNSELAAYTDTLIKRLASASAAQGGEFYTSSEIADLLVCLLDPEPGKSIYDPACGTGSLLVAAFNFAESKSKGNLATRIYGQEIDVLNAGLARVNALLHGISSAAFSNGDSLTKLSAETKFDFVITNPPVGLRHSDQYYELIRELKTADFAFGPPTKVGDYNFVQHVLSQLCQTGRAVMLLGLRPLFIGGREGDVRRALIESDVIETVITLAPNVLPYTNLQSAVLIFNKNKPAEKHNKIQFIFADDEYQSVGRTQNTIPLQSRQKIIETFRGFEARNHFSAITEITDVAANEFLLLPAQYVGISDVKVSLGSDVKWMSLSDLANVFRGTSVGRQPEGNVPVIQGRDLSVSYLSIDHLEKKNVPSALLKPVYSQAGDVLIQRIGQRPQAFLVEDNLAGLLISDTVYVVRFDHDNRRRARYIVEFLNSTPGQAQLTSATAGAVIPTVGLTRLRKVLVPIPSDAVIELVNNLHEVEHTLFERMNTARLLRQKLFSIENQEEVAHELRSLSIDAQVLSQSIIRVDEPDFQIRNYYPYVLAFGYRSLDSISGEQKLYKEQLRLAENLLAFLGSIGLILTSWSGANRADDPNAITQESLREYWRKGISPGDWSDMGSKTGRLLRGNEQHAALVSFSNLWFKGRGGKQSRFRDMLSQLVERKNAFKHDRGPQTDDEYTSAVKEVGYLIKECFRHIAFLVQHPTRLIQESDVDWKTQQIIANTLLYIGDHPSLRRERIKLSSAVSKDKLYLEVKSDVLVPLYPLFSVQNCSFCKMREVFMIDRYDGVGDRVVLKSFERGHAHDNDEVARSVGDDLEHWLQLSFLNPSGRT